MRILRPDIEWGARGYLPIKWEMEQLIPTGGGKIHAPAQRPPQPKPQPWFSCAPPPLIPFGDIKGLRKDTYRHNDEAE
uniref:Uncharacterized protein n=1 Tax=Anguilla anguilla TaxID=7936 RepID=A0A0E9TK64_ANGAN